MGQLSITWRLEREHSALRQHKVEERELLARLRAELRRPEIYPEGGR